MCSNFTAIKENVLDPLTDENVLTEQKDGSIPGGSVSGIADQTNPPSGPTPTTDDKMVCSSDSSYCRICQTGNEGSDEPLETSRCECKGHLAKVHKSCLTEWVRYQGSNLCEICGGTFLDIPRPVGRMGVNQLDAAVTTGPSPSPPEMLYFQALEALRTQLNQYQPVTRRKRTALAGIVVFLLLVTGVTGILTIGADQDFQRTNSDPWASDAELRKTHIIFSICISFLFFCVTLTLGLVLMWLVLECYFYAQRRRILRHAALRMIADAGRQRQREIRINI